MEISVVITNYNYGRFISRAVRSVIDQSFPKEEYEIIVVDDGSADESDLVLKSYSGFIRIIKNENNLGLPKSCNIGIKNALGKYVIRLDADDYFHKDILKIEQIFLAYNKDYGAISCDYYEVSNDESILSRKDGEKFPIACGIMFRADCMVDIGLYNENLRINEDIDLRKRFEEKYKIRNVEVPLYRYRKHGDSMSS